MKGTDFLKLLSPYFGIWRHKNHRPTGHLPGIPNGQPGPVLYNLQFVQIIKRILPGPHNKLFVTDTNNSQLLIIYPGFGNVNINFDNNNFLICTEHIHQTLFSNVAKKRQVETNLNLLKHHETKRNPQYSLRIKIDNIPYWVIIHIYRYLPENSAEICLSNITFIREIKNKTVAPG